MSTQPDAKPINPLSLKPEDYDILNMLRVMDKHLEAKEYELKFSKEERRPEVEPGLETEKPKPKQLKTQLIKGRKIINRVLGAKRFQFAAKVMLHKNDRYIKGKILNISKSGIFVSTELGVFKENETLRLYIRPKGMQKSYKAIATVMRFNDDPRYPTGYGLKFVLPTS